MAGTPYLVDSNILLRWVKPDHNDYPLVVSAIDAILRGNDVLLYVTECRRILEHVYSSSRPQWLRSFPSRNGPAGHSSSGRSDKVD